MLSYGTASTLCCVSAAITCVTMLMLLSNKATEQSTTKIIL